MFRKSAKQGCRIWAITLFRLQASYLFARFDMFRSSGEGGGRRGRVARKSDSAFIYPAGEAEKQKQGRGEKRAGSWKCQRESERVGPAELWVDERTRPPR